MSRSDLSPDPTSTPKGSVPRIPQRFPAVSRRPGKVLVPPFRHLRTGNGERGTDQATSEEQQRLDDLAQRYPEAA
jgi:hypothetical protein